MREKYKKKDDYRILPEFDFLKRNNLTPNQEQHLEQTQSQGFKM